MLVIPSCCGTLSMFAKRAVFSPVSWRTGNGASVLPAPTTQWEHINRELDTVAKARGVGFPPASSLSIRSFRSKLIASAFLTVLFLVFLYTRSSSHRSPFRLLAPLHFTLASPRAKFFERTKAKKTTEQIPTLTIYNWNVKHFPCLCRIHRGIHAFRTSPPSLRGVCFSLLYSTV